jgi:hypothetical protein
MRQPTISVDLQKPGDYWTVQTVEVPVAEVEERLIEQHGGLLDVDGDPLSEQVWFDAAVELAQRRACTRRAG